MSYQIRTRFDPTDAPSDKKTRYQNWLDSFQTVGSDSRYREHEARDDGTMEAYDEFVGRFSVGEDPVAIVDDLSGRLQSFQGGLWHRLGYHVCDHDV